MKRHDDTWKEVYAQECVNVPKSVIKIVGHKAAFLMAIIHAGDVDTLSDNEVLYLSKRECIVRKGQLTGKAAVKLLKSKQLKGRGVGNKQCEWCEISTLATHKHHYPVYASEGGTETSEICGGCHAEFHHLVDRGNVIEIGPLFKHHFEQV